MTLGCSPSNNIPFVPSIDSLEANETLVMKLHACHHGCTKGIVKFKNKEVILGRHSLKLNAKEISELDRYFLLGEAVGSRWRCTLPIYIRFHKVRGLLTVNSKGWQIYPCPYPYDESVVTPEQLVRFLSETPTETPYWRLSPEEKDKVNVIVVPEED